MIEFDWVITNGYVDKETIFKRVEKGWTFVATVPAKLIHPKACDTTIFSKYTPYEYESVAESAGE